MVESDERESVVLDLSIKEESMQRSQVSNSRCDNVKKTISDVDSYYDDKENLILSPMKDNYVVKITWNEENKVMNPNFLMSSEQSLRKEIIQSVHE